jgi:hypothetical protein
MSKSKLQKAVTTSSCEAEIAALYAAVSETVWLRRLLESMGYSPTSPTILYEDNQGAIKYSSTRESYGRMKHIDIKHMFIREQMDKGIIQIKFVPSTENPGQILVN